MKAFLFVIIFISVLVFVTATEENVIFNGDFLSNTTLYSNTSFFSQVNFTGRDVYPIRTSDQNIRIKNCTTQYRNDTKRMCVSEIIGYKEKTRRVCRTQNRQTTCTTETYLVPIKKRVCETVITLKPYEKCTYITLNQTVIGCQNPTGNPTNQLKLENFFYTIDEINWGVVPYTKINFTDVNLTFKVDIPLNCSPEYDINKAINLSYSAD